MNNEYKYTLEQFILEFGEDNEITHEKHVGVEFTYKNQRYRMCREGLCDNDYYLYKVVSVIESKNILEPNIYNYETLGIFNNLDELLNSCAIDSRKFKDILFDEENTEILSFD